MHSYNQTTGGELRVYLVQLPHSTDEEIVLSFFR